ncbi:uncharacterized protein BHQ10_010205 [Talaromyces amestolkiae]|uniref:Uncharacterized protein n=1 Tax=Talaromyces amestolkiae TaxID=1196081 RepID=A0A364LEI0_TALAM|nr:uncharacterized protein BHQ10_010205 [Talaromyces amestolkiae]RAO74193.1 hypothetical protein BHQ10_010205 [Talaromyces amestolkiae]
MAKQTNAKASRRRRQTAAAGLVTPIAGIDLSRCGGNLTIPVRDLEWLEPRAQALDTSYRRKAAKIYTHGTVADTAPCSRCAAGKGPFRKCVIAWDDQGYIANGNCANCYWFHKTSSCNRRYILPCEALAKAGKDLGEFQEACSIHCNGTHIPDASVAANHHVAESSDEEEESVDEAEEDDGMDENDEDDDDDDDDDDDEDGYYEVEEAEEAEDDEDLFDGYDDDALFTEKRKADNDADYKSLKAKKVRGFTPINFDRL